MADLGSGKPAETGRPRVHRAAGRAVSKRTAGLNHVVLTVPDVARSRAFYDGLLGFEVVIEEDPGKSFFFAAGA